MRTFGARIRETRERAKISMADVAAAMEVSVVYVSDIERGRRNPPAGEKLRRMAAALNLDFKEVEEWAIKERQRVELDLDTRTEVVSNAALMLARRWDTLSDEEAGQIINILNRSKEHD